MDIYSQIAKLGSNLDPAGEFQQGANWKNQNALFKMRQEQAQQAQEQKNALMQLRNQLAVAPPEARPEIMAKLFATDPSQGAAAKQFYTQMDPKVYNMTPGGALVDTSGKVLYRNTFKPEGAPQQQISGGLPVPTDAPYRGFSDPKKSDDLRKFYAQEGYKQIKDMAKEARTSASTISDIDRFLKLNETNYTGAATDVIGVRGLRGMFDKEFSEMSSISDKLTPRMRQGLPGAASDRDVKMFANATIGIGKPAGANKNIGLGLKVAEQNKIDLSQFMQAYYRQNGSLLGAEEAWSQYLEANPIFDPAADDGSYMLNPNRQSWKEHFGIVNSTKSLKGYRGTPKNAAGPAKINSDAEYNALPSGAVFIGPDGKQRRKP